MIANKNKDGLILTGTLVASDVTSGVRKDDGKAWARRTAMISTGTKVVTFSETVDPSLENQAYDLGSRVIVDVAYTNTQNGNISVGGDLILDDTLEKNTTNFTGELLEE